LIRKLSIFFPFFIAATNHLGFAATGIDYLFRAQEEGRIKAGFLVLMRENKIVATKDIAAVASMVSNVAPRDGDLGPYYWFNADGTPYAPPGAAAELAPDDPLPF
jgi:hypothetical protein